MGAMKPSNKPAAIAQAKADQQAAELKAEEAARQGRIREGRGVIDTTFNTKFSDDYFKKYQDDYTGYYMPQLDDKFAKTKQDLIYALASSGILGSSAGIEKLAEADKELAAKKLQVSSEATDASNNLRSNVEKQRSGLYALNESSADPAAATSRATAEATALAAPVSYSPLGDVFAGLLNGIGGFAQGMQSNPNSPWYTKSGGVGATAAGGKGSSKVTGA